jgi:hypothetical protein
MNYVDARHLEKLLPHKVELFIEALWFDSRAAFA